MSNEATEARMERLAKLEAKFDIFMDLLKEIRDDVKGFPTQEEVTRLEDRVARLEKAQMSMALKVAAGSGVLSILVTLVVRYILSA